VSFLLDCVDGKLARSLNVTSDRGKALDAMADGARRASAAIGLGFYLWGMEAPATDLLWLVVFAVLSFYFMEISGDPRREHSDPFPKRWSRALARRRLLPNPGMPDVSAIVYVVGPLAGWIWQSLLVGSCLIAAGIVMTFSRRMNRLN
jgi:phosphatidylglycerophosphate synthase